MRTDKTGVQKLKKYETVFILDETRSTEGGKDFVENLNSVAEEMGGNILETEEIGHRQFSHPIKKKASGVYWNVTINLPANKVSDFKDRFRLDQSVIRCEIFCFNRPEKEKVETS